MVRFETSSPRSRIIFAVGPFTARPPMMGETPTTGALAARIASLIPGTARIGSMLMKGLDGQTTTQASAGPESASSTALDGRAASAPSNSKPVTAGSHRSRTK